jgi:FkbM family methyltransferase
MNVVKRLVSGTPFEPLARWALYRATGNVAGNKNWHYDRQTIEVMRSVLRCDSSFVDIGCHKGDILRQAITLAPNGKHWGFEPLPHLYSGIKDEFKEVNLFNVALSDRKGEQEFTHVVSSPALSGFLKREAANNEAVEIIAVPTDTLDNIIDTNRVDMIKIDVEGAELLVLRGAARPISQNKPAIVFEHGLGGADRYGNTPEQVFDLLSESGMKLSTMKRYLRRDSPLSRQQFCAHFYQGKDFMFMAY